MAAIRIDKSKLFKTMWKLLNSKKSEYNTKSAALEKAWEVEKQNLADRQNAAKNEWDYSQYAGFGKSDFNGYYRFSYDINNNLL